MTEGKLTGRLTAYFATPVDLSTEERARRSGIVGRAAAAQLLGLLIIVAAYGTALLTDPQMEQQPVTWAGLGLLLLACPIVIVLARRHHPVEGAWILVVLSSIGVALVSGYESPVPLSGILFLWPIIVAGTALPGKVAYIVAGTDTLLFLLPSLIRGLPSTSASTSSTTALLYYGTIFVVSFFFAAYITQRSAASLTAIIEESESRAQEILSASETLLEKNLQQLELSTDLSSSATALSATSRDQASGAAQQASAISEVTSTIEEMGYTARQIAQSVENVAQVAEQTLEAVGRGQTAMDESVSVMEGIKGRVQELAEKVLALGEHSQRIGEIIEIINDIADETHLLALNAAIESAGAGEYGRRFAVVAAEVKNLANRAIDSSKEVRGIIAEIQQATNASVMAAEEGLKETERGVQQIYEAGHAMEEIVMLSQRTTEAAQEISLSTTQQRTASEQIVETMREIADVANQTAEGSRQLANAATRLQSIAEQLQSTGRTSMPME